MTALKMSWKVAKHVKSNAIIIADSEGTVDGSPVAQVVDTVGAGDGFAVGIVSAYLDGLDWHAALHRGNLIGARQVQVIGDMEGLPNREQLVAMERSGDAR